jgi:hypothetical protein
MIRALKVDSISCLVCSLVFVLYSVNVRGQSNVIKVDAFKMVSGRYQIAYERKISDFFTAEISLEYGLFATGNINGTRDYTLSGTIASVELRYFPFSKSKRAPLGFFIGESVRYSRYSEKYNNLFQGGRFPLEASSQVTSFNLLAGYKFSYKKFCIEALATVGLIREIHYDARRNDIPITYSANLTLIEPLYYLTRLGIGYMF